MYPFQQTNELSIENTNDNNVSMVQDQNMIEDQIWMDDNNNNNGGASAGLASINPHPFVLNNAARRGRSQKSSLVSTDTIVNSDQNLHKKLIHREIERQRRQEMSQLFASLHSVLPAGYAKAKRSTSDQLDEAMAYIKDLEKNVKELGDKRDLLKASVNSSPSARFEGGGSSSNCTPWLGSGSVVILPREGGLDIEISVFEESGFCLSSAIQVVYEEGIDSVASCASTKVDQKRLHHIICEVVDVQCIDVDRLQMRLINLLG